jgi:RNA polymerase sigma-70 factor (ECF subfamily)
VSAPCDTTEAQRVSAADSLPGGDLLLLVRRGRLDEAMRLLMQRYGTELYAYCRRGLQDAALAEDVHQQTFIEAYRDLPRYQPQPHVTLRAWLFAIARHRILDAAKSRRRRQSHISTDDDLMDAPDPQPSADDSIHAKRLEQALMESLAELDPHVRTLLLLRFQQGFSYEEIANVCGGTPSSIHHRVARALPGLRKLMESRGWRV